MARQKGFMKLTGTMGDINFYVMKGKGYARKAGGGFTGEAIKSKESMRRVRENGKEFGGASRVKKKFLEAFQPYIRKGDRSFHGRCVGLFLKLKNLDTTSARGERCVEKGLRTAEGQRIFRAFEFAKPSMFLDIQARRWIFEGELQRLEIPSFVSSEFGELKKTSALRLSLFLVDFDFGPVLFQKHLLDQKTVALEENIAAFDLCPTSVVSVSNIPIYSLGLEFLDEKGIIFRTGMKVV